MLFRFQRAQLTVLVCVALGCVAWAAPTYTFTSVMGPTDLAFTQLLGINNSGTIAGYSGDGTMFPNKGFTLVLPSSFTPENFPSSDQTQVIGINAAGHTDGFYITAGITHGFVNIGGPPTTVDFTLFGSVLTQLLGINNSDEAAGYWQNGAGTQFPVTWKGGTFTGLDSHLPANMSAQATGVNDAGDVSGFYVDSGGVNHGFLLMGSTEKTLDVPGSTFTQALGVNNAGDVVGVYMASGASHGFLYNGTSFFSIDDPNGIGTTTINGTNDKGQIVGFYVNGSKTIGFQGTPTPEPGSLALLGSGALVGLGFVRRKLMR